MLLLMGRENAWTILIDFREPLTMQLISSESE